MVIAADVLGHRLVARTNVIVTDGRRPGRGVSALATIESGSRTGLDDGCERRVRR
jgi:hypothetical protein